MLVILLPTPRIVKAFMLDVFNVLVVLSQDKFEELIIEFVPPNNNWLETKEDVPVPPLIIGNIPKVILLAFKLVISLPEPKIVGANTPPSPEVLPSPTQPCVIVPLILTLPKTSKI